jgi:NitT/TauT family transport system substrate-binding protein
MTMLAMSTRDSRRRFLRGLGVAGVALMLDGGRSAAVASATRLRAPSDRRFAAVGQESTEDAPLDPPVSVRSGLVGSVAEAGQLIALERGYFQEQGLSVELVPFDNTARMTPSLATGDLDVGAGGVSAGLFNAIARGVPIRIVGPQAQHDPGASGVYFMVRADLIASGAFSDYPDLRGLRIAIPARGTAPDFAVGLALARAGLSPTDCELVELSFPDMVPALANGAIDVAVQAEPAAAQAVNRGAAVKWRELADIRPGIQFTVVLYSPQFVEHPEAARRWMLAYLKGVRDYNDAFKHNRGRAEVVEILTRQTPVKSPALYEQMGFASIDPNGRVGRVSLAEQLDWYVAQGLVTQVIDLEQAIDLRFADFALERLGPYA